MRSRKLFCVGVTFRASTPAQGERDGESVGPGGVSVQVLQVQLEIDADPLEVGRARRWARCRLASLGLAADEPAAETVVLLISELVTNAVVHTGRPALLRLLLPAAAAGGTRPVRVEVVDTSSRPPRRRQAEGEDTGGRGLELVACLADRWGWQREDGGKSIWCELDGVRGEGVAADRRNAAGGSAVPA